jgi:MFS family permease
MQSLEDSAGLPGKERATPYAWLIFALILALMLSDYMSRQVLGAVAPLLKAEWGLGDEQLGRLGSIIPLMVGLLTFPLSLLADRFGRVRAIVAMALIWSAATLACGLARNFPEMLAARAAVGIGEAAYGSVGLAVIIGAFPVRMRAVLTAAFMSGGTLGSVLGVATGGAIAASHGWRWAFGGMAVAGLVLTLVFAAVAREKRLAPRVSSSRPPLSSLFSNRALLLVYIGSGLQLFVAGSLIFWLPAWFGRTWELDLRSASTAAAGVLLIQALGMVVFGQISDWIAAKRGGNARFKLAIGVGLMTPALLVPAFLLAPSGLQIALLLAGVFVAAGTTGPVGALVGELTPPALHATAFATVALANNVLGLAPGPWATGLLAEGIGLSVGLAFAASVPLLASGAFSLAMASKRRADA